MIYCSRINCPITDCIRNYTIQYALQRQPMKVSEAWRKNCPWNSELFVGPLLEELEDDDG